MFWRNLSKSIASDLQSSKQRFPRHTFSRFDSHVFVQRVLQMYSVIQFKVGWIERSLHTLDSFVIYEIINGYCEAQSTIAERQMK
jgi:hypothetical protein